MNYQLGKTSGKRLATCHEDLQLIAQEAIKLSPIDFGIAEGERSLERQKQLFDAGLSKIDGIRKKGKHNCSPSLAFDIYAFVKGKANWEHHNLALISGVILAVGSALLASGQISHRLRWGGNWDMDGEILTDQQFDDMPHFELIEN